MLTDSLIGKYVGSTDSSMGKYLTYFVNLSMVYYVRTFRFDFSYSSSRREAALFYQTQAFTCIRYFPTGKYILWRD